MALFKKGGLLAKIFTRVPGGSVLGNLVRGVVHSVTHGIAGNGMLMLKPDENATEANDRTIPAIGAIAADVLKVQQLYTGDTGVVAPAVTGAATPTFLDKVKSGFESEFIKNNWKVFVPGFLIIPVLIIALYNHKKNK